LKQNSTLISPAHPNSSCSFDHNLLRTRG
jgi:hypothetical protein